MGESITRRGLLAAPPGFSLAAALLCGLPLQPAEAAPEEGKSPLWPGFPRQDAQLVRAVVGAAHGQEAKVKELVEARPALVNAWWDWGFGDWESPLGAAAHTGQRAIAEYLIARGARIDIFAAAMLGHTDVVRAFVAAQPGVQRTPGPHGIPLIVHARLGGEKAAQTVAYLESLGDAGTTPKVAPLADDRKQLFPGRYAIQGAGAEHLEVKLSPRGQLFLELRGGPGETITRNIHHAGDDEFYPAGVPSVRIRFEVVEGRARSLKLVNGEPVITASRID